MAEEDWRLATLMTLGSVAALWIGHGLRYVTGWPDNLTVFALLEEAMLGGIAGLMTYLKISRRNDLSNSS